MASFSKLSSHVDGNEQQSKISKTSILVQFFPSGMKSELKKLGRFWSRKKPSPQNLITEAPTSQYVEYNSSDTDHQTSTLNNTGQFYEDIDKGTNSNVSLGSQASQTDKQCSSALVLGPKQEHHGVAGAITQSEPFDQSMSGSAYHEAWQSLEENQKSDLIREETIKPLFEQLYETDQLHRENSPLRRGLSKSEPYLEKLNSIIDLASPFVSLDVTAGTALGLIKGTISIAVAICGYADELTDTIEKFLQHIPAIDRCDSLATECNRIPDIHHTLVNMYKVLLQFYLDTAAIFKKANSNIGIAMGMLKPGTKLALDSFSSYADTLDFLLKSETFASTQEIKEAMADKLIHDTLNLGRDQEEAYHNEFGDRADKGCSWIDSDAGFSSWVSDLSSPHVLTMAGDMGCGKTTTSAYVADTLSNRFKANTLSYCSKGVVCCYYCRDNETTSLGSIYRSLIWQLLRAKPNLKFRYFQWHKMASSSIEPTRSIVHLRELLFTTIHASPERIFVVLDGLDELKVKDRKALLSLFQDLLNKMALFKLFISSRDDVEISRAFRDDITRVKVCASRERDRVIASYLIVKETSISQEFHEEVASELAGRANGSAIWLRIAIQYLEKIHLSKPDGLGEALEKLPSSYNGLAKLYLGLFKKTCDDMRENELRLQLALEMVATARRPLSLYEISYAVVLGMEERDNFATISDLDRKVDSTSLESLIRPFVSIIKPGDDDPQYRLVHQSLKELVFWGSPERWHSVGGDTSTQPESEERSLELNKRLLQCCMKYLLLDDCDELDLETKFKYETESDFLSRFNLEENETDLDVLISGVPTGAVTPLLRSDFQPPEFLRDSIRIVLEELVENSEFSSIKSFLGNPKTWPGLQEFATFHDLVACWRGLSLQNREAPEWVSIFDSLINILRENILREDLVWSGNSILCMAAHRGCLVLIQRLFEAGKTDFDLMAAILAIGSERFLYGLKQKDFQMNQSIGQAICGGYADIVDFLCQQDGTEHHLRYVNPEGHTLFRRWAEHPNMRVFKILIKYWPEGVHLRDVHGDTPLLVFLKRFSNVREERIIEYLQMFMKMGQDDLSGKDNEACFTPLHRALEWRKMKVCRFLITDGMADIYSVVGVDEKVQKPILKGLVLCPGEDQVHVEQKILKELCLLLPLAVSTEFLV